MSVSEFQAALHERYTTIKACNHKSNYAVLRDYVDRKFLLCHACWNEEKPVRINEDTVHIFKPNQMHVVLVRCLRCGTDVTAQKGCTGCFPAG